MDTIKFAKVRENAIIPSKILKTLGTIYMEFLKEMKMRIEL